METGNRHLLKRHRLVKYPILSPNAALGDRPQGKGCTRTPSAPTKPTPAIAFVPPPAAPASATRRQCNSPPPLGPPIALIPQDPKKHHFPHYIPHPCSPEALSGTNPAAPIAVDAIDVSRIPGDADVLQPLRRGQRADAVRPRGLLRCPLTRHYINCLEPGLFSFVLPTALCSSTLFA